MTTLTHVADIERNLGIELIGTESEKQDFHEELISFDGSTVDHITTRFTRFTFNATGFNFFQNGGVISGDFAAPVHVATVEVDEDGIETNNDIDEAVIARAVLTKLGGIPDIEGGLRAAAGV